MRYKEFVIALVLSFVLFSCSLERSNPVDPQNNTDVTVPGEISDINLNPSTSSSVVKFMEIEWNSIPNIDGYYLYKARTYDGEYVRVDTDGIAPSDSLYYKDTDVQANEIYYYRISAFVNVEEFVLEGRRSIPRGEKVR